MRKRGRPITCGRTSAWDFSSRPPSSSRLTASPPSSTCARAICWKPRAEPTGGRSNMQAEPDAVLVERRGSTGLVTLNRAAAFNAVNDAMREALIEALAQLNRDSSVRAVIITGAGDRAFCSGQDLNETARYGVDDVDHWLTRQHAMYRAVRDLDKPCI